MSTFVEEYVKFDHAALSDVYPNAQLEYDAARTRNKKKYIVGYSNKHRKISRGYHRLN